MVPPFGAGAFIVVTRNRFNLYRGIHLHADDAMQNDEPSNPGRRTFLSHTLNATGAIAVGPALWDISMLTGADTMDPDNLGALQPADANGIRLPPGFTSRVIARSGRLVRKESGWWPYTAYAWHVFPDGGATFATDDGGWIYVSNSEVPLAGGAGAIRFDRYGRIRDAYPILQGTQNNCAGGPTPWGTWLSCEEVPFGRVFECDPLGRWREAVARPALGYFKHEAAAVDPFHQHVYLTEDEPDGRLYRFTPERLTPAGHPDLTRGILEVAIVDGTQQVAWVPLINPRPDPTRLEPPTRKQIPESTPFDGGEGMWYHSGVIYFTTKGTNQVWALDTASQHLEVIYDAATAPDPILKGVDNVTTSSSGDVLVAEDGDDMQLVAIGRNGEVRPLLMVEDQNHSEVTGPAFSPDGNRLYFSSQRGPEDTALRNTGITYEITGPFRARTG